LHEIKPRVPYSSADINWRNNSSRTNKEKTVYQTKQEASDTAHQIEKEQRLFLKAYQCPHGNGWHLAKADPGQWDDYLY